MICGSGNFKHVDDGPWSAPSSPKAAAARATSSPRNSRKKASKNPYSTRGLDKYSTVVSELEARRAQIMEKVGPDGSSMVWFMHSNTDDWKPIVVKLDDDSKRPSDAKKKSSSAPSSPPHPPPTAAAKEVSPPQPKQAATAKGKKRFSSWREWIEPKYYWLVVLVMILACLTLFGRVFAICCTSIWWYLMPALQEEAAAVSARRRPEKKDFYRTGLGDVRTNVDFRPFSPPKRSGAHHF